ncbi:MAG: phosphatase PAP2 family protein, partial [Chitinophagaceae bacterium]|nr:phosphatase PAP2 family protein [Chitinophagaceae bacterium]
VYLIQNKKDLAATELINKTKEDVIFFDCGSAGYYSEKANDDSYLPFYGSFAMPVVMGLINKNQRNKFGQIMVLYTQTMAITSSMFTITAGAINRSRPLVYGTKAPSDLRLAGKSQRSFYAGHTAASAAATFFAAKVFQDFYPHSKAKPYVWALAATVPAITGYLRYKAGYHFLSDNILGYIIGAGTGILIPKMHKNKNLNNITIIPEAGNNYKGISFTYHF